LVVDCLGVLADCPHCTPPRPPLARGHAVPEEGEGEGEGVCHGGGCLRLGCIQVEGLKVFSIPRRCCHSPLFLDVAASSLPEARFLFCVGVGRVASATKDSTLYIQASHMLGTCARLAGCATRCRPDTGAAGPRLWRAFSSNDSIKPGTPLGVDQQSRVIKFRTVDGEEVGCQKVPKATHPMPARAVRPCRPPPPPPPHSAEHHRCNTCSVPPFCVPPSSSETSALECSWERTKSGR
jgi:hypothetical protein